MRPARPVTAAAAGEAGRPPGSAPRRAGPTGKALWPPPGPAERGRQNGAEGLSVPGRRGLLQGQDGV